MLRFMLDTDICSYVMRRSKRSVIEKLHAQAVSQVCMSVITKSELLFGVAVSPRGIKDRTALEGLLLYVPVLDLPDAAANHYADIRADLQRRGTPIGGHELLLAAHARCLGLTLVTNNVREFSRVSGLEIENWAE